MGLVSSGEGYLGVDIGSSGIKIVELKKEGSKVRLLTYGFSENSQANGENLMDNIEYTSQLLNKLCKDAGVHSKTAVGALPAFAVFSSVLNLSNVNSKDMASAVNWEAKKVIPLPLEEMILDWKIIEKAKDKKGGMKVLLTGAPKTLVKKYIEIFKTSHLNLHSLETETFSLIRSLMGNDKSTVMIVEVGNSTTDITIASNMIPTFSRSIDVGGMSITKAFSEKGKMDSAVAEQFKFDLSASSMGKKETELPKAVEDVVAPVLNEIKYAINLYQTKEGKKIEKIILSGGSSMLVNLDGYLSKVLNMTVILGDPWNRISCPEELKPLLSEVGPRLAVSVGLALRGIY